MKRPDYKIINIVAAAHTRRLDLAKLSDELRIEYEPRVFPAAKYRSLEPKASLLLFESGSIICTGCKTKSDVKKAFREVIESIGKVYKRKLKISHINITNMVASSDLGLELDLDNAYSILREHGLAMYEPEMFPGLAFWPFEGKTTSILLFKTGKAICAGAKNESTIKNAFEKLSKILEEYKRSSS